MEVDHRARNCRLLKIVRLAGILDARRRYYGSDEDFVRKSFRAYSQVTFRLFVMKLGYEEADIMEHQVKEQSDQIFRQLALMRAKRLFPHSHSIAWVYTLAKVSLRATSANRHIVGSYVRDISTESPALLTYPSSRQLHELHIHAPFFTLFHPNKSRSRFKQFIELKTHCPFSYKHILQ